jgi:pimeloyl-ACP methyl ester carboxylesterase
VVLAYQVTGQGPMDLVFVPGWISNIELAWELRLLSRLASFARLIWFDKRGTGLSDRVADPVTLEERTDDIRAVMDAAGSRRAAVLGWYEGGAIAASFAASNPERVRALVIGSFTARAAHDAGEPWDIDPAMMDIISKRAEDAWGTAAIAGLVSPSTARDPRFLAFWRRYERASASPTAAGTMIRWNLAIDVRATLPAISCPTWSSTARTSASFPRPLPAMWPARSQAAGTPNSTARTCSRSSGTARPFWMPFRSS